MYSDSDRFSRAVFLLIMIPLLLPHMNLHGIGPIIIDYFMVAIFFLVLYFYAGDLKKLYGIGGKEKLLVKVIIITAIFNFGFSFFLISSKSLGVVLGLWVFLVSYRASKIYKESKGSKK